MISKRQAIIAGIAVAVVGVAGAAVASRVMKPAPAVQLPFAVAQVGDVEHDVLATGSLQPANTVQVGAEVSGKITELRVKLGDRVTAGQIIAIIDAQRLQNMLREQENNIQQAESTLQDRVAQLDFAKVSADRQQQLYDRGASSQAQLETALATYRSRQSQLDNQRQQIEQQKMVLEQRRTELNKATIRAPIDGIVAEVVSHQGDVVTTQRETPIIVKLANVDLMMVQAQVSEADIGKIQPGLKAYFTILGQPGLRRYATVKSREITPSGGTLDTSVQAKTRADAVYYNVVFEAPNEDGQLLPSMTAEVHVVLNEAQNVLTVPVTALKKGKDKDSSVRVLNASGQPVERKVKVGVHNSTVAEITDGLKAGDKVVVADADG